MKNLAKKKKIIIRKTVVIICALLIISVIGVACYKIADTVVRSFAGTYTAEYFNIETVKSDVDFNGNGVDDYTDMVSGARSYIETKPTYNGDYVAGGYPPDGQGVCTDVIWQAFAAAGYDLKAMVDSDIAENTSLYPRVEGKPDPNIDFRRVSNLNVFFSRFAESLTTDTDELDQWQPGDIVVYDILHIAIVSDVRNYKGKPYIIHNGGYFTCGEQDRLEANRIIGHYRFNAAAVEEASLAAWKNEEVR